MNTSLNTLVSVILAISFHGAVLGLLLMNWNDEKVVENTKIQPYYIDANIVSENPLRAKAQKVAEQKRRLQKKLHQEQARQEAIRARQAKEKQAAQAEISQQAIDKAKQTDIEKQLADQAVQEKDKDKQQTLSTGDALQVSEQERLKMEQSLALSIMEEQDFRRAVTDDEKAMAYVSQIQRDIIQNWSRPPSARNGMQALLRVYLVPTGEVVNVVVEESSGNEAFDRSALLAVQKTERFQVPAEPRQFERNFREFTVFFKPDDLRL